MDFSAEYKHLQELTDDALDACFTADCTQSELLEAMRYSLLAGGKRIRPILLLKFCEAAGGDLESALPCACSVEMLHTYSLIHDDLPCMDNDELRRGRPTNHVVYGECTAVLAGDALQAAAFETLLTAPLDGAVLAKMALELATAAGEMGMCGGQILDMSCLEDEPDADTLAEISRLKTGALLKAACVMGVLAAGQDSGSAMAAAAAEYALNLGLAFQIRDDVLDAESTTEALGKPAGSDEKSGKTTFYSLLGAAECMRLAAEYTQRAKAALEGVFENRQFLCRLADMLAGREA